MTLPREVQLPAVDALTGSTSADRRPEPAPVPPQRSSDSALRRARAFAGRAYRGAARRLLAPVLAPTHDLRHELTLARARIAELESRGFQSAPSRVDLAILAEELRANTVNQTLLKAEFGDVLRRFEDLGFAIAPAAGIDAASTRLAEQREHLAAIDRRVRILDSRLTDSIASSTVAPGPVAPKEPASAGEPVPGFDYVGFERRFRGEPETVLRIQRERYVPLLSGHAPVVDIGCGRGELLAALAEAGVDGVGVEPEPGMAAEARARGLTIHETDALSYLRSTEPGSLGAIFSAHVVEHVELDYLLEFIHLAVSRLKPGGIFVAETPNPSSLIVLGNSYILDPTHVRPLHPALLSFLCENAGFRDVRLDFHSPADGYRLPLADEGLGSVAHVVNQGFSRLNEVLFGAQEYTVVATRGPE